MYTPLKKGGMAKSRKYRQWIEKTAPIFSQLSPAEHFPVVVDILVVGGSNFNNQHDIDNLAKPIVDSLVRCQIVPDDSTRYIEAVSPRFIYGAGKSKAQIKIAVIEPELPEETF
jgi:Holliday junction resolvase RusA-like endonuclease